VTDQSPTQTTKPWPRKKLDLHVTRRIREQVDVALVLYRNDDDGLEAMLREGGEDAVWRVVREAIDDAGWQVCSQHGPVHGSVTGTARQC